MKRFAVLLAVVVSVPWIAARAEDGSVQGEKKYTSVGTSTGERNVRVNRATRIAPARGKVVTAKRHFWRPRSWRVGYYQHADAKPWWPRAPGD
jgi:hypothetical protein